MDEKLFEMAEALERAQRDSAMAEVAKANAPQSHPDFDGKHCIDCEMKIPQQRLAMGKIRCVECQGRKERCRANKT